jgi:hypothetical protein
MRDTNEFVEVLESILDGLANLRQVVSRMDQPLTSMRESLDRIDKLIHHQDVEKEWYGTAELAEALGVTQHTVQERWCNQHRIEAQKDSVTGKWRIPCHEFSRLVRGGALRPRGK